MVEKLKIMILFNRIKYKYRWNRKVNIKEKKSIFKQLKSNVFHAESYYCKYYLLCCINLRQ